jgi:hypothetical protein
MKTMETLGDKGKSIYEAIFILVRKAVESKDEKEKK